MPNSTSNSQPGENGRILETLVNSAGLWMILFSGFGLLCLSIGEKKIQNRMIRHQLRMTTTVVDNQTGNEVTDNSATANPPIAKPYPLFSLRVILSAVIFCGVVVIGNDLYKLNAATRR